MWPLGGVLVEVGDWKTGFSTKQGVLIPKGQHMKTSEFRGGDNEISNKCGICKHMMDATFQSCLHFILICTDLNNLTILKKILVDVWNQFSPSSHKRTVQV